MICCAIGKDRTGISVALILSLLGHSKEYVAWDYSLSEVRLNYYIANKILEGLELTRSNGYITNMILV